MMAKRATPPVVLVRHAHIAAFLRSEMKKRGWRTARDLADAVGVSVAATYPWTNGYGAPAPAARAKLTAFFKVPETTFKALIARAKDPPAAIEPPPRSLAVTPTRTPDVLSFQVLADGTARIRFDCVLPIEPAKSLLRILLDAEALMKGEDHAI